MKRIYIYIFTALILLASCTSRDRYITFSGYAQGGTYTVKFNLNGRDGMIKEAPEAIRDSVEAILQNIVLYLRLGQ